MRLLLLAALAVVASGCVYSRSASLASAQDRAEINARAARGHAVLAVDGRRGRQVRDLQIAADTTTWTDKKTGETWSAPTASVSGVTFRRDGAGALKGLAVGIGVGAALGLMASTGDSGGFISFPPEAWAAIGAADGAFFGLLIGAIHSERHAYRVASPAGGASRQSVESCGGLPLACAVSPPCRP